MKRTALLLSCLLASLMVASAWPLTPAHADDDDRAQMQAARAALDAGEIQPLAELLNQVEQQCNGRFVEMELDRDDGVWIYEIKLLGPRGDVAELEYDARDLSLVEAEGQRLGLLECVPPGTPD